MDEGKPIHAFSFDVFVLEVFPPNEARGYAQRRLFINRTGKQKHEVMVPSKRTGQLRPGSPGALKLLAYLAEGRLERSAPREFSRREIIDGNWGEAVMISENALDKAIGEVRDLLLESDHTILQTVPRSGYRFVPDVRDLAAEASRGDDEPGEALEIRYLKDDEEGAKQLQRLFQSPSLKRVFNTYFRFEQHEGEYQPETVKGLIEALTSFVDRSIKVDGRPCVFQVLGGYPEIPYLESLIKLAGCDRQHEKKIAFYRLRQNMPLMNFVILEYAGQNRSLPEFKVLFGWGGHRASSTEAVFQSSKKELVDQFRELYELLMASNDRMRLSDMRVWLENLKADPTKTDHEIPAKPAQLPGRVPGAAAPRTRQDRSKA